MLVDDREIYLNLTKASGLTLCAFCESVEFMGCEDGCACTHPDLEDSDFNTFIPGALDEGQDCDKFEPSHDLDFIVDIISVVLQNGFYAWMYKTFPDGTVKIYGRKADEIKV